MAHHVAADGLEQQVQIDETPSDGEEPPLLVPEMPTTGSTTYVAARELLTEMSRSMEDLETRLSARQKVGDARTAQETIRTPDSRPCQLPEKCVWLLVQVSPDVWALSLNVPCSRDVRVFRLSAHSVPLTLLSADCMTGVQDIGESTVHLQTIRTVSREVMQVPRLRARQVAGRS